MARAAGSGSGPALGLLAGVAFLKAACDGGGDSGEGPVSEALVGVLASVGPDVVEPALARAGDAATALLAAAEAWKVAEAAGDGAAARLDAQAAWWTAMEAWQEVELFQIGPLGSSLTAVAGADGRDGVYSWPTVNRCRVDQETVYAGWDAPDFFETTLVNVQGLDALEVLLFAPVGENDCAAQVDINAEGGWDALGEAGVQANRAAYAVALAAEVADDVAALRAAWSADGGDFSGAIARAGEPGSAYESPEEALDAVSDALFYLETVTKDRKLGYALGNGDCAESSCIDEIESPLAGGSHRWIAVNLRSFRTLYTGGEGQGLDELLRALGEDATADAMLTALDAADVAALAVTEPLDAAVLADPAPIAALQDAVDAVTDLLAGDVATALALQVPSEAAGDAD